MKRLLTPQNRNSSIKREQKKSLFFRTISSYIGLLGADEPAVRALFVTRIELSPDASMCYVYFGTFEEPAEEIFEANLEQLKLYKPSLRKAMATELNQRHVPDIVFRFDANKEKERRINSILDKVQQELRGDAPTGDVDDQ